MRSGIFPGEAVSPILRGLLRLSLRYPRTVLLAWVALALLATLGVRSLEFDTTASSLLNRSDPAWQHYRASLDLFGGDEILVAAVEGRRPFDPAALREVSRLTDLAESLPGVRRVDSLTTVPIVRSTPDGTLVLDPAIRNGPPRTFEEAERVARIVSKDRIAPRSLVSADGRVFAVNVLLEDGNDGRQGQIVEALEAAVDGSGWVSGVPLFESRVGPRTQREVTLFIPLTLLLIGALLYTLFRSASAVAVPLIASATGSWVLVGLMGAAGTPMTIVAMLLPSILLALGCAYLMHVLTELERADTPEALEAVLFEVAPPIALSGLTTALGFFAISTVDIDAIRDLGAFGGVGVLATLAATLTLAPALLRLRRPRVRAASLDRVIRGPVSSGLVSGIARWRVALVVAWVAALGATSLGLARLEIETDGTRWWPPGTPVRDAYESIRSRLSGISPMNVVLRAESDTAVTDPAVLERIDALTRHLDGLDEVGKAVSVADPLRQIHGGFVGEPRDPLPRRRDLVEQYLLLLESVEHVRDLVSPDRATANVVLRVDHNGSRHLLAVANEAERWWREHGAEGVSARATGIMFEFARAQEAIAWGQIRGLALALGAIAVILLLLLRSPGLAVIALVPNAVPLVIIFGVMGLLSVPLDAGTACLGSLALGIAVDDTIHVVTRYRSARRRGLLQQDALQETFARVLPALVYTTAAIGLGFAVLGLSEFTLTRNLGVVTASLVILCLAADVTLLPVLLLGFRRRPKT